MECDDLILWTLSSRNRNRTSITTGCLIWYSGGSLSLASSSRCNIREIVFSVGDIGSCGYIGGASIISGFRNVSNTWSVEVTSINKYSSHA